MTYRYQLHCRDGRRGDGGEDPGPTVVPSGEEAQHLAVPGAAQDARPVIDCHDRE